MYFLIFLLTCYIADSGDAKYIRIQNPKPINTWAEPVNALPYTQPEWNLRTSKIENITVNVTAQDDLKSNLLPVNANVTINDSIKSDQVTQANFINVFDNSVKKNCSHHKPHIVVTILANTRLTPRKRPIFEEFRPPRDKFFDPVQHFLEYIMMNQFMKDFSVLNNEIENFENEVQIDKRYNYNLKRNPSSENANNITKPLNNDTMNATSHENIPVEFVGLKQSDEAGNAKEFNPFLTKPVKDIINGSVEMINASTYSPSFTGEIKESVNKKRDLLPGEITAIENTAKELVNDPKTVNNTKAVWNHTKENFSDEMKRILGVWV